MQINVVCGRISSEAVERNMTIWRMSEGGWGGYLLSGKYHVQVELREGKNSAHTGKADPNYCGGSGAASTYHLRTSL